MRWYPTKSNTSTPRHDTNNVLNSLLHKLYILLICSQVRTQTCYICIRSISLVRSKLIYGQEVYFPAPNTDTPKEISSNDSKAINLATGPCSCAYKSCTIKSYAKAGIYYSVGFKCDVTRSHVVTIGNRRFFSIVMLDKVLTLLCEGLGPGHWRVLVTVWVQDGVVSTTGPGWGPRYVCERHALLVVDTLKCTVQEGAWLALKQHTAREDDVVQSRVGKERLTSGSFHHRRKEETVDKDCSEV